MIGSACTISPTGFIEECALAPGAADIGGIGVKLTSEDLQKIHTKQVANIIRKLGEGKTITAREQKILDEESAVGDSPTAHALPARNYTDSWDELADAIPIDRRTLFNFRQNYAALIKQRKKQLDRADGRHCVAEWRKLLDECEIRGRGENNPDLRDAGMIDVKQLVLRERQLAVEREEFKLAKEKNLYLEVTECQAAFAATVSRFNGALNALPGRASGKILPRARAAVIRALRKALDEKTFKLVDAKLPKDFAIDFADVEETLSAEVDLVKRTLSECDYLKPEAG